MENINVNCLESNAGSNLAKYENPEIVGLLREMDLHGEDGQGGTDKGTVHNYTGIYARLLQPYRERSINFLEVGIGNGGSLALWCRYLPRARFLCMDCANNLRPKAERFIDRARCHFYFEDAYTEAAVARMKEVFADGIDFAVDDGLHTQESMSRFLQLYSPHMKPGGVMVIEDVPDVIWLETFKAFVPENYTVKCWDAHVDTGRWDDIMLLVYT